MWSWVRCGGGRVDGHPGAVRESKIPAHAQYDDFPVEVSAFKLSLRDLVEMLSERGLSIAHTTIMRWVRHYAPEFEQCWQRFAGEVGRSWRVDETYVQIHGEWCNLYRAVDRAGRTVDFRLSTRRNQNREDLRLGWLARAEWTPDWLEEIAPGGSLDFTVSFLRNPSNLASANYSAWDGGPTLAFKRRF